MLNQELEQIPIDLKEPTVTLLFSGNPVIGSMGIDAAFLGKALVPFQKMVHSDLAQRGYGKVGSRGMIKNTEDARLFLTSLPRGSFGVELTKLNENEQFDESRVSDSLVHVSRLIDSSAKSDEDFVASLDEISPRTIQSLKDFLKVVSDDRAGVTIESGGIRSSLTNEDVQIAYNRLSDTSTLTNEIKVNGVLKGILLESWKFDFLADSGETITGSLDYDLSEQDAANIISKLFNKPCLATLQKTTVTLKNGRIKDSYVLKGVEPLRGSFKFDDPIPEFPITPFPVIEKR